MGMCGRVLRVRGMEVPRRMGVRVWTVAGIVV
jgi:hypothetical protein